MHPWLNRQRYLADVALASFARRRFRTAAILVVYSAAVAVLAAVMLYSQAVRHDATRLLQGSPAVLVQRSIAGRHQPVPASYAEHLRRIRGVQAVEGRLWGDYYDPALRATCTLMVPLPHSGLEVSPRQVRIGSAIARGLHVGVGHRLPLLAADGTVVIVDIVEILPEGADRVTADVLLVSPQDFRTVFGYPDDVFTDVALTVANPAEHRNVAAKAAARLPDTRVLVRDDLVRTYSAIFDWREGLMLVVLLSVVASFAVFAFDRASGLSTAESREIAILRAIGWETGDVLRMKLWESLILSATAFSLGYLAAYVCVFYVPAGPFDSALRGWSTLRPAIRLTPAVDVFQLATLFLLSVVPYGAAVLVPVWRAAVCDPDSVIRG